MDLLLHLLKAFGITLGACVLLLVLPWSLVFVVTWLLSGRFRDFWFIRDIGIKDLDAVTIKPAVPLVLFAFIFFLTLGVLSLPPQWRVCGAVGAVSLVLGVYFWVLRNPAYFRSGFPGDGGGNE